MILTNKEDKIKWYEENVHQQNFLKSKYKTYEFLEEQGLLDLLEKSKKLNTKTFLKEELYKWAYETEAPKCPVCGKPTKFDRLKYNFRKFCSRSCSSNSEEIREKVRQTNLKNRGCCYPMQSKEVRNKSKETVIQKYGVDNVVKNPEIAAKIVSKLQEKYGPEITNAFQAKEVKEKIQQTCLERYGTKAYSQSEEHKQRVPEIVKKFHKTNLQHWGSKTYAESEHFKENKDKCLEKRAETCLEKYGVESYYQSQEFREYLKSEKYKTEILPAAVEKGKQTCLEKYGSESFTQSQEFKENVSGYLEKRKQTCLDKYGVESYSSTDECKEKLKQTCLDKYGVENIFQAEEFKEKRKATCLEKYGVEEPTKSQEIKEKTKQTCLERYGEESYTKTTECKERRRQTCLEKYKKENYSQTVEFQEKQYATKKANNSFNSSKSEDYVYAKLLTRFSDVKRQHKSEEYPFTCDFYIPEVDLYIEFQGYWTHGYEAYNPENLEHRKIVEQWIEKSKETNVFGCNKKLYENAIDTWTIRDVEKRKTAKDNRLNWLEFFNQKEFDEWFNSLT